jgi:hypothetical protein
MADQTTEDIAQAFDTAGPAAEPPVIVPADPPVNVPADPPVIVPADPPVNVPADPPVIVPADPPVIVPDEAPEIAPDEATGEASTRAATLDALAALGTLAARTGAVTLGDALDAVEDGYAEHQEVGGAIE